MRALRSSGEIRDGDDEVVISSKSLIDRDALSLHIQLVN